MYYSHACNRDVFIKVTIAMFYICHSKNPSNIIKNIFNSISTYSWNKISLLTNIKNKSVIIKINLYFFEVMKGGKIVPSKVFQYNQRFFFSKKWRTCKEICLQRLIKFRLQ